jgi:hypothetical protein
MIDLDALLDDWFSARRTLEFAREQCQNSSSLYTIHPERNKPVIVRQALEFAPVWRTRQMPQ